MRNANMHKAKKEKNDEFYTQNEDVENELKNYREHFRGKSILCNCDDPAVSEFFLYFKRNFDVLQLKKLVGICYKSTDSSTHTNLDSKDEAVYQIITTYNKEMTRKTIYADKYDSNNPEATLYEAGDFRSKASISFLKKADIVVTNPPFSLFREYVAQLVECNRKFLIIGNINAITYKEIFPLIRDNKMWLGVNYPKKFTQPDGTVKTVGACWFTNLEHNERNAEIILTATYNEADYPKYDNYDAINVDKVKDIPKDYYGEMGVPITFMSNYNPNQFEIIGIDRHLMEEKTNKTSRFFINGKEKYARIIIKRKQ